MPKKARNTAELLQSARAKLNRVERFLALEKEQARKADVHKKIKMGGLIVKSGLDKLSTAELLGLLLEAKIRIEQEAACTAKWQTIGDTALLEDTQRKIKQRSNNVE